MPNRIPLSNPKYGLLPRKSPLSKEFWVLDNSSSFYGDLSHVLENDRDSDVRIHTSLAAALDSCVANRGDIIHLLPGHTETVTAQIDLDVAGVRIIGHGQGSDRPTFTGNGTIDLFDVSAANMSLENIICAAPETDAQTAHVNVDAAYFTLKDVEMVGSQTAKNVVDCITVTANADNLVVGGLLIYNRVVAVNSFVSFEGAASTVTLKNVRCFGDVDTAGIIDGAKIDYLFMEDVQVATVGTTKPAATLDSNPEGMARNCFFAGTSATLADNANLGNLMRVDNIKVLEETDNSKSAAIIPAVDVD